MTRTETITRTLYSFDELDNAGKQRARDWWRQSDINDDDNYYTLEDAAKVADLLGITLAKHPVKLMGGGTRYDPSILYSGFSSQGDGACFEGSYAYRAGSVAAIKDYAPTDTKLHAIAEGLANLQYQNHNDIEATVKHNGHYYHEYCTEIDVALYNSETVIPEDTEKAVKELLRDFMRWIYRQLEADHDYRMSDENVDESILANGYEFTEDGRRA